MWTIPAALLVHVHARRRGDLDAYARRMRLVVPPGRRGELAAILAGWERATRRDGFRGLAVGVVVGAVLLLAGAPVTAGGVVVLWASVLGTGLATRAHVTAVAPAPSVTGTRVARLADLRGDDFSTVWERAAMRLAPPVMLLAAAVPVVVRMATTGATREGDAVVVVAVLACLVALVAWFALRTAERRLVDAPELARDEQDLAWLDAFRASTVRDLREAAGAVAIMSSGVALGAAAWILLGVPQQVTSDPELTRVLTIALLVMLGVLWLPLIVLSQVGRLTANPALRLRAGQR